MDNQKFFWIASSKYMTEAKFSAESVRRHHPNAELALFHTDEFIKGDNPFDVVLKYPRPGYKYWFLESVYFMNRALNFYEDGDKIVYLDTDTYVCGPLDDIFEGLERFDFLGVHAPGRATAPTVDPIPDSFPEYNIGVQGIRVGQEMRMFFGMWLGRYKKYQNIYKNNDQAPLRETIWNHYGALDFGTLPTEFNFRFQMGGQVRDKVRVLHGRSDDYAALEKQVNPSDKRIIRAWKSGHLK